MAGLARGERLQIMLTDEELVALDDWRFDKRMPSRASAVRELLKRGLAAEGVVFGAGSTRGISAFSTCREDIQDIIAGPVAKRISWGPSDARLQAPRGNMK